MSDQCIVKGCTNRREQGNFAGDLCAPCHHCLATGKIGPTDSFLGELAVKIQRLERENRILELETDIEEDLSNRIAEMHKYLAMEQGYTMAGIARLLTDCQKRMAADWVEIGRLRHPCGSLGKEMK